MEKAKEARTANEAGGELDSVKLAVVSAMAKGTYGMVEFDKLNAELAGIGLSATEGTDENSKTVFKVTGKTGIQYEINPNGNVTVKSEITLNSTTITLSDEKTTETLTATLSADLSGTIEWSLADGTVSGSISSNSVVSITPLTGKTITVTKVGDGGSTTITAKLNGTQYPVTCIAKIKGPSVETYKERAIANGVTALNASANTIIQDTYGNNVIIPAGFGIATDSGESVEDGIVIEDVTNHNQFVWIPVGTGTKGINVSSRVSSTGKIDIPMARYDWIDTKEAISGDTAIKGWTGAKNTEKFFTESDDETVIEKMNNKGGFYIGRYEAGYVNGTAVCRAGPEVEIWNEVPQSSALSLSQKMYNSKTNLYQSDLMNGYAWDTAIDFIQKCGTKENSSNYAYQIGYSALDNSDPKAPGTNKLQKDINGNNLTIGVTDEQCNIYDMAGNVVEWTTENCSYSSSNSSTYRGGYFMNSNYFTATRSFGGRKTHAVSDRSYILIIRKYKIDELIVDLQ